MAEQTNTEDRIAGLESQLQQMAQNMQAMMTLIQGGIPAPVPTRPVEGTEHKPIEEDEHVAPEIQKEDPPLTDKVEEKFKAEERRICLLEQQIKKFHSSPMYRPDEDFGTYQSVHVPERFKIPDFDKYTGNSCPRTHVRVYLNKMAKYADEDQLLIRTFIESLAGSAIRWYINLKLSEYISFSELANAFVRQYDFNSEMAPTLSSLEKMTKGREESFKEYARRWREAAAQIHPLPGELELINAFIKTLKPPYFAALLSCNAETFSALAKVGDRIDEAIRDGRIFDKEQHPNQSKPGRGKEKAVEVNAAFQAPSAQPFTFPVAQKSAGPSQRQSDSPRSFTPLPKGMTYEDILSALLHEKLVELEPPRHKPNTPSYRPDEKCAFHSGAPGHSTERCLRLRHLLQNLLEAKKVAFPPESGPNVNRNPLPNHGSVNCILEVLEIEENTVCGISPLIFEQVDGKVILSRPTSSEPLVLTTSPPPPVDSLKQVPWNYDRSVQLIKSELPADLPAIKESAPIKPSVSQEDMEKVLKAIGSSEYHTVEQLKSMPAQISLLELMNSSEKHRDVIVKILNEVHVPESIQEDRLEQFVGAIAARDQIAFTDQEILEEGRGHNKALHLTVHCRGMEVGRVLIDNGSALNICPLSTLRKLGVDEALIRVAKASVQAFDGTKKKVTGEIELEVTIGPTNFLILFYVLDIPSAFNMLLGRPWIHMAGAVPSSLHQKVKFIVDGRIITVHAEPDLKAFGKTAIPNVTTGEEGEASSYQTLELVSVVHIPAGAILSTPRISTYAVRIAKQLIARGYRVGKGLGRNHQGILKPLSLPSNKHKHGLGFKQSRNIAKARHGKTPKGIPHIRVTFPAPAYIQGAEDVITELEQLVIAVIEEGPESGDDSIVPIKKALNNWVSVSRTTK